MNNKRIVDLYLLVKLGRALQVKTEQMASYSCALDVRGNPLAKGYSSFFIGMEIEVHCLNFFFYLEVYSQ